MKDVRVYFQIAFDSMFIAHEPIALPKWHTQTDLVRFDPVFCSVRFVCAKRVVRCLREKETVNDELLLAPDMLDPETLEFPR